MWLTGQVCKRYVSENYGKTCGLSTDAINAVDFADLPKSFSSTDDGDCLDRDLIPESGAFTVDDTWGKDVASHSFSFACLEDGGVRLRRL